MILDKVNEMKIFETQDNLTFLKFKNLVNKTIPPNFLRNNEKYSTGVSTNNSSTKTLSQVNQDKSEYEFLTRTPNLSSNLSIKENLDKINFSKSNPIMNTDKQNNHQLMRNFAFKSVKIINSKFAPENKTKLRNFNRNRNYDNVQILKVQITIELNEVRTLVLCKYDNIYERIKEFCELNDLNKCLIIPLLNKIAFSLKGIYNLLNNTMSVNEVKHFKFMNILFSDEFIDENNMNISSISNISEYDNDIGESDIKLNKTF